MKIDLNRVHALADAARERAERMAPTDERGPSRTRSWYKIENAAGKDEKAAEVYVYDMIGVWGVTAQSFVDELRGIKAKSVDLHINSEGGEVFDGLAIYESIVRHPADFTAYVDGLAASAASFIAVAAGRVVMAPRARMMIHDAHGVAMGNAKDLREMAVLLDDLSDTIADIYAEKAGSGTRASWRETMQAAEGGPDGTWYDAAGAVKAGLADEVRGDTPDDRLSRATGAVAELAGVPASMVSDWAWGADVLSSFNTLIDDIEHPAPPVRIPDGRAIFEGLRLP